MWILFASLMLVMMGYGIAMPILPFYIEDLGGRGIHYGLLIACYALMQFICAPIWGSLSDKHGRKPLLLIGMTGLGTTMLLFGLATELWMLYVAQLLSGCLSSAAVPAAQAYAADSTSPEDRGAAMGRIGGAIGLGVVIGPAVGGLLGSVSFSTPFFIASALCYLTFTIILTSLPESLASDKRATTTKVRFTEPKEFWQVLHTPIGFGLIAAFVANFGQSIFSGVFGLYAMARYNYGPEQVGTFFMAMGLMYAASQGLVVGPLTKRIGEEKVMVIALLGGALGFLLIILANSFVTLLLAMSCFILLNSLLKPSALSLVSKRAHTNQGKSMGIAESYMSLGRITGPLWGGMIFDVNPVYPFVSGAIVFIAMFTVAVRRLDLKPNARLWAP